MRIPVEIDNKDMEDLLRFLCNKNNITPSQYVNNIVTGWLESQLRGMYQDYFRDASLEELQAALGRYTVIKAAKQNGN